MIKEKIEGYMFHLSLTFDAVDEHTWIIRDPERGVDNVVVYAEDSLVTVRVRVMDVPQPVPDRLYEDLLRLNLEMVHGAYALEDEHIVLLDTLEFETMDLEEFQASVDSIGLALAQHYEQLKAYR